jgi:hypothetical protein
VTTLTRPRAGTGTGGVPAHRAVFRWGWRLFRREWRQQLLVLGLLTAAVAAMIWGASVVTNTQLPNPNYATFGTAAALVTLPGTDPHLAADIAAIQGRWGPADLIENQDIATGITQPVQLRAERPHGHYNSPLLSLVSGTYPAGPGQVALISQLSSAQAARLGGQVNSLAASLHARSVPLESAVTLYQVGTEENGPGSFSGSVSVATPQLLATYGIKASQIAPGTDILTMRPGLAGLPHMEMTWQSPGYRGPGGNEPGSSGGPPCTLSNGCLANPAIQTISSLPSGTSAPNTVITEHAVSKYHLQSAVQLSGWLIQAPAPLTAAQINAARHLALAYGVTVETKSGTPGLGEFAGGATALGIVIAFGVLAASVGLIRSETARDLRTLTATGASPMTRRMITAATAAALGLLGAILGMAGALVAGLAWAHSSLSGMFGGLPLSDVLVLLAGLPLVAAAGGWLLAGREPEAIARQPLD